MNFIKSIIPTSLISLTFIFVLEISLRTFSDLTFVGTNQNLFELTDQGKVAGNKKSTISYSFGEEVYINKFGYRVSKKNFVNEKPPSNNNIIFLGDSVAFWVGVSFENTFQGILERLYPQYAYINTSVIGFNLSNYE